MPEDTTGLVNSRKRFNVNNPPPPGHEYTGKFYLGLWNDARDEKIVRLGLHERWLELHKQWRGKRKRKTYPIVGMNYVFKTIQGFCAILTEKTPRAEITSDEAPEHEIKALDKETQNWWEEKELQNMLYASVQNMEVYGTTIEKFVLDKAEDTSKVILRDPFNSFPAPKYKMCDIDNLPYYCDAYFLPTHEVREKFEVPIHVNIPSDADIQLFGGERETIRGGKEAKVGTQTHLPSNYARIPGRKSTQASVENHTLVVEIWIKDNSMIEEPIFEDVQQPLINEQSGLPVLDDMGRAVPGEIVQEQTGTKNVRAYKDGIRKVTICPGLIQSTPYGVLDDSPNPSINWELLRQRIAYLVETGIPQPIVDEATGQPVIDPATQQPVMQVVPMSEEEAQSIVFEMAEKWFLWGRFPFSAIPSLIDTTQWWGFSIIEQLEELQGKVEALLTKFFAYYDKVMFPILIIPKNCGVEDSQVTNEPGLILRPNLATAQNRAIYYVESPHAPMGLLDFITFILFQLNVLSGTPEVTEGRRPKGVSAASAIIALQDKAATLFTPQIRAVDMLVRNRGRAHISMVQNWGTKEKPLKVDDEFVKFVGINLTAAFKYMVESGSSAPITKAGRRQQYIELFKIGAMDLESLLTMLEIPRVEVVVERLTEQNSLPGAMDILIQAGLPEEDAVQLYRFLMQSQGGTGRSNPQGGDGGKKQTIGPHKGASEGMKRVLSNADGRGGIMPKPHKNESKKDYIRRAIKYIIEEEHGSGTRGYAYNKAKGLWKKHKGDK